MSRFTTNLISTFRKPARVRSASNRVRRSALQVESLEQRSMLTSIVPIGAPLPDSPAADDVIVDGRIITGENYDAAISEDPSIVRKLVGRTSFQPVGGSASGGGGGHDIIFGGGGNDDSLESSSNSRHSGGANFLLADGSVHFTKHSGGVNVLMGDGSVRFIRDSIDTVLANGFQAETNGDATAQSGPVQSEWKYVTVRPTASPASGDTGVDLDGRPITYTGLEQSSDGEATFTFSAFGGFTGGVNVAAGDVNGDVFIDVIVSPGVSGHVKVIDGSHISVSGRITSVAVDPSVDYGQIDRYTSVWVN